MRRRILVGFGLLVAVIVAVVALGPSKSAHATRSAPALPTEVLVAPRSTLASLRGQPAAINFWASWCGPCRKEAPELARLSRELGGRAHLIGVDWNDNASNARAFIKRYGWEFPNLRDADGTVGNQYGIFGLPTTFILNRQGRIVAKLIGPQTAAGIKQRLAQVHD